MNRSYTIQWPGWQTVGLIGRGSYGAVYCIQRAVFDEVERAALKVITIPRDQRDIYELFREGYDHKTVSSILRDHMKSIVTEYSIMRKMSGCTNVVSCDDVKCVPHEDGIGWDIYIKMELLRPLTATLPEKPDEKTVLDVGIGICTALEVCKHFGIVHRDIKPQNIFVSPLGDYKLGDFGVAKTIEKTMSGTVTGTYKYMAPEVFNNQPYGATADLYSLGLVLYWMLNERRLPFFPLPPVMPTFAIDQEARRRRLVGEPIPEPLHGCEDLKRIILKACAFDPKDRYATAKEMKEALLAVRLSGGTPLPAENKPQNDDCFGGLEPRAMTEREITAAIRSVDQPRKPIVEEKTAKIHYGWVQNEASHQADDRTAFLQGEATHFIERTGKEDLRHIAFDREQHNPRRKKTWKLLMILAASVSILVIALLGTILSLSVGRWNRVVMTVGDKEITAREFNYFFYETAHSYSTYASYLGIDTAKPLADQTIYAENITMLPLLGMDVDVLDPYKREDGSYDITWAGYFALLARNSCAQTWAIYQSAENDSQYRVSEEIKTAIQDEMQNIELYGELYGMDDGDDFLKALYGSGSNMKSYEEYIRASYIASDYADYCWFSDEDIDAQYHSSPADYDVVTYLRYSVGVSDFANGEGREDTEAADKAKKAAENMEESFNVDAMNVMIFADQTIDSVELYTTDEAAKWMFETAKAGDVKLFEDPNYETYYVVKVLSNDINYLCPDMIEIYLPYDEDPNSAYSKLSVIEDALAADGSEDRFSDLADEYSENNYTYAYYSYADIATISQDALVWALEDRKAGEYGVFTNDYGIYVLYFLGRDQSYRDWIVNADLVQEWIEELAAETIAKCSFDMERALDSVARLTPLEKSDSE